MIYIYSLIYQNKISYVGITKNPKVRKQQHKREKPLPHEFKIIESVDDVQTATEREISLIEKYNTIINGWNISPGGDYALNSGYKRTGIGGVKMGQTPWNKGKSGCFSNETIDAMKKTRAGRIFSSKVNEDIVKQIRERFVNHPIIEGVGKIQPNGKVLTQQRAFSNKYHKEYNITNISLYNIMIGKSWSKIQ